MFVQVSAGDVLNMPADVLISSANPWLNMSGGVNGEILERCGERVQIELNEYLEERGLKAVPAASVVPTSSGSLPFQHILHAVAIDPFYDSSELLVGRTISTALELVDVFGANSVAIAALATGYGPISFEGFARALCESICEKTYLVERINVVVRSEENRKTVSETMVNLLNEKSRTDIRVLTV